MIFNWNEEFTENQILNGIDLMSDITEVDRTINELSGTVNENGEEYWVKIELNDDFTIKSLKCSCKKHRCHHMTALLQDDMEHFKRDMDCRVFLEDIKADKLMKFIENQLIINWECQEDFIEKFRVEMLKSDKLKTEDKLFLILRYPKRDDLLTEFVKDDLTELYGENPIEAFYLITSMFNTVLSDISFNEKSQLWECWRMIEDLIVEFSKIEPELVKKFMYSCREEGYGISFREFGKLLSKLNNS